MLKQIFSIIFLFLTTIIYTQVPTDIPTNGLVGWWPFNGNANDESDGENDGIVVNSILCDDRFGIHNAAYDFNSTDGTEKYIRCLNNETLNFNNYTISLWFKLDETFVSNSGGPDEENGGILQKGCDSEICGSSYRIYVHTPWGLVTDNWVNNDCFSRVYVDTTIYSTYHNWNHVVSTYDGSINKLYVNGVLVNQSPQSGQLSHNENDLIFGGWFSSPSGDCQFSGSFSGKLDDIGMWNRALTNDEVLKLYRASSPETTTNTGGHIINNFDINLDIYPNPTTDVVNIDFHDLNKFEGGKVKIMSMSGQIVYEENITQSKMTLSVVDRLSKGIYIVTTTDSGGNILSNEKLIVQ
jgi:hypothetical protein